MSETKEYCVYKHTNKTNGKVYIGITCQKPEHRWNNGKNYKGVRFSSAINKYGWDGFDHLVLVRGLSEDEAKWLEVQLIAVYDSTNRKKGYNVSLGGDIISEESRKKMSDAKKDIKGEKHPMYGKKLSNEHRRKLSKNHADFKGKNHPMYGKHHTEEARKRMSESKKGKNNPKSKLIICLTTGYCFYGSAEASEYYGICKSSVGECCNGKRKSAGKLSDGTKLRWAYVKDLPKPQLTDEQKQNLKNGPKLLKLA